MPIHRHVLAVLGRRTSAVALNGQPIPPSDMGAAVALNPQPLPPAEIGAALAAEFTRAIWFADRMGLDAGAVVADLDDWCPTRPRVPKLPPWWWPWPPPPEPGPDWLIDLHLGFAGRLSAVAVDFEGTGIGDALSKAIDRSLVSIENLVE